MTRAHFVGMTVRYARSITMENVNTLLVAFTFITILSMGIAGVLILYLAGALAEMQA